MAVLDTRISSVVVFPDRARVTRSGRLHVAPGAHRLEVADLPLTVDPESVRAAARGTARARLRGVDLIKQVLEETPVERVRDLERQVEGLGDERLEKVALISLLEEEKQGLVGLTKSTEVFARGLARGTLDPQTHLGLLQGVRKRVVEIDAESLRVAQVVRELDRRLLQLREELKRLSSAGGRGRFVAVLELEILQGGELEVDLTYLVSGSEWVPLYDCRLLEGERPRLEVTYLAQVTQRTGEGWEDVELTLSTARPALATRPPQLKPWVLAAPAPATSRAAPASGKPLLAGAMVEHRARVSEASLEEESGAPEPEVEAAVVMATVASTGAAVTYAIPVKVSVPSDGTAHKVTVAGIVLEPRLDWVTAPKLVEAVHRRARARNSSPYTFLPGRTSLCAENEHVGSTQVELVASGGELELFFGVDDRVKVQRKLVRREVDKKLLSDRRTLAFGYEIVVESLLDHPITVTVRDQLPTSRHELVKVKGEELQPEPTERTELGLVTWELRLEPAATQTIRIGFVVEHPREITVTGLP